MEYLDVLDEHGNKTGKAHERSAPLGAGEYHLIVDVWIVNGERNYLLSRRSPDKAPFEGMWEPTCGCAHSGEESSRAALREVKEELGIALLPCNGRLLRRIVNHEYQYHLDIWLFEQEVNIEHVVLQPGETDDVMWATLRKIQRLQRLGRFLPNDRIPYIAFLP